MTHTTEELLARADAAIAGSTLTATCYINLICDLAAHIREIEGRSGEAADEIERTLLRAGFLQAEKCGCWVRSQFLPMHKCPLTPNAQVQARAAGTSPGTAS